MRVALGRRRIKTSREPSAHAWFASFGGRLPRSDGTLKGTPPPIPRSKMANGPHYQATQSWWFGFGGWALLLVGRWEPLSSKPPIQTNQLREADTGNFRQPSTTAKPRTMEPTHAGAHRSAARGLRSLGSCLKRGSFQRFLKIMCQECASHSLKVDPVGRCFAGTSKPGPFRKLLRSLQRKASKGPPRPPPPPHFQKENTQKSVSPLV